MQLTDPCHTATKRQGHTSFMRSKQTNFIKTCLRQIEKVKAKLGAWNIDSFADTMLMMQLQMNISTASAVNVSRLQGMPSNHVNRMNPSHVMEPSHAKYKPYTKLVVYTITS